MLREKNHLYCNYGGLSWVPVLFLVTFWLTGFDTQTCNLCLVGNS